MGADISEILERRETSFDALSGEIVAIDAYNALYQFLSTIRQRDGTPLKDSNNRITSHLSGLIYRTTNLMGKGIKPVFVFDGKPPHLKAKVLKIRSERRKEAKRKWEEAKEKFPDKAFKYAQASTRINTVIVEDAQLLLTYMGVPFVAAPSEGEAQAAYIARKGDADAVSSQDYDSVLFGAPTLIRNLSVARKKKAEPEVIELSATEEKSGITREQLIDIAILVGTDFNEGIKGIGAKTALKLIKKHQNIEKVISEIGEGTAKGIENYEEVRSIFLHSDVNDSYEIKRMEVDEEKVKEFLCEEHDFSEERVSNALKRIPRVNIAQRKIENWF